MEIDDVTRAFFRGNMSLYLGRTNDWLQLKVYIQGSTLCSKMLLMESGHFPTSVLPTEQGPGEQPEGDNWPLTCFPRIQSHTSGQLNR